MSVVLEVEVEVDGNDATVVTTWRGTGWVRVTPEEPDWEQISKDRAEEKGMTVEQVERAYERWAYGE